MKVEGGTSVKVGGGFRMKVEAGILVVDLFKGTDGGA